MMKRRTCYRIIHRATGAAIGSRKASLLRSIAGAALAITLLLFASVNAMAAAFTSLSVDAQSGSLTYGTAGAVTYQVIVTSTGNGNNPQTCAFGPVTGLPSGVIASFDPDPVERRGLGDEISTLTLSTSATTPAGVFSFAVSCVENGGATISNNGSLTVNQRPITITADAKNKIYGNADPALTYQLTSGSMVGGDTLSGTLSRAAGENVGTYAILIGTLANANYAITYVSANLTINLRPITVTADAKSKNVGQADPLLTYQITSGSLAFSDTFSGALTRTAGETPGTYPILQGTLALSANYALAYLAANLTINNTTPAGFNAFESSTAAGAITGKIFTKLAGAAFSLDVVAIFSGAQMNSFNDTAIVELVGNQNTGVALDAQNCPTSFTLIQTVAPNPPIASGRSAVNFAVVANAWRDVRVRIRFPVGSPTVIACSTDNFSIRPTGFSVTSTDATNTGTSGAPAIKTGANFNLTATAIAGYNGTPAINNLKVTGTPAAGAIGGSFGAAAAATGIAAGSTFYYSEVGNVGLLAYAVYDGSFTSVDAPGVDCRTGTEAESFSNTLAGGQYGCSFGSAAVVQSTGATGFGRFIPDNFGVSYNTPEFGAACGTFTYVGQPFAYATAPVMTVTARNGTNNGLSNSTTANYAGAYAKLTNASVTPNTQAARYARFDALAPPPGNTPALDTTGLPAVATDPAISIFLNGVTTLTFNSGTGLIFTRGTTTKAPFDADIALAMNVIDTDAVAYAGNPAQFGAASAGNGIAFGGGSKAMRFGRLKLSNAYGSELLNLPVPIGTEYWGGTSFMPNIQDNCTSIAAGNVTMGGYLGGINAGNMSSANVNIGGAFNAGKGSLVLTKPLPAPATKGSVDITIDLATEDKTYLRGGPTFSSDPTARATFGIYKRGPVIYVREMY